MMGRLPRRRTYEKWEYTLASEAREESGFEVMEEYSWRRQNTVTQFIDTQSLLDLCEETERTPGARVGVWWWEQAGFDLAGARETTESAEEADGDGMANRFLLPPLLNPSTHPNGICSMMMTMIVISPPLPTPSL